MLRVDLGQLERKGRIRIDGAVPGDEASWDGAIAGLAGGVEVRLDVQTAGSDIVVRGTFRAQVREECRRCLQPVEFEAADEVTLVYRQGLSDAEAEAQEVYTLGVGARELDLGPALREHLILSVPRYPVCRESCRGLCPRCGKNLNAGPCECRETEVDPRWGALREMTK
jgi:uncharacterized protein